MIGGMKIIFLIFIPVFLLSCASPKVKYNHPIQADPLRMCFIGDVGIDHPDQQKVADMLEKEKCHSIHFLGDIIYEKGLKNHHDKQFIKKFWKYYEKLTLIDNKPMLYITLGNHDHHKSVDAWVRLSEKHPKIFFPYPYYFVRINDVCLTHMDTDYFRLWGNYLMLYSEVNWLGDIEKDLKDCRSKIALGHHPYISSGKDHGNSGFPMRQIYNSKILGKYDFLIAGHEHILSDEGNKKGTRLLISGAGGQRDSGYKNGFLVLTFKGQEKPQVEFREAN
jgi:predicted phosphodiesterase